MDVSIIIINYNTFELTGNAVRSIYRFTTGIEFEIILVDNGSTECDAVFFKNEFPTITLVKNPENIGFAKGNNLGIREAKGTYILLLNSDVLLTEDSISKCADKLSSLSPNIAAITCKLVYPDGRIQPQCNRFPDIGNEFLEFTRIHKLFSKENRANQFLSAYFDHLSDVYPDWIWGTFFMFKKEYLQLLPAHTLNDEYFMYAEDMKWCYDFKTIGKQVYYFAGTSIIHYLGKSYADKTNPGTNNVRNEFDFLLKTKGRLYMRVYRIMRFLNVTFSTPGSNIQG